MQRSPSLVPVVFYFSAVWSAFIINGLMAHPIIFQHASLFLLLPAYICVAHHTGCACTVYDQAVFARHAVFAVIFL